MVSITLFSRLRCGYSTVVLFLYFFSEIEICVQQMISEVPVLLPQSDLSITQISYQYIRIDVVINVCTFKCVLLVAFAPNCCYYAAQHSKYTWFILIIYQYAVAWLVEALSWKPRSRFRIPMRSLDISIGLILPTEMLLWGPLSL
jgi:hypothetical protein